MPQALIRDAASGRWLAFTDPTDVLVAEAPRDVALVLREVDRRARQERSYAVGFLSYEAAGGLEPKHPTHSPGALPPAWFALYAAARPVPPPAPPAHLEPLSWRPNEEPEAYYRAVEEIRRLIRAGDTYQVNFSYRLRADVPPAGDFPRRLFEHMVSRQPGGYGAFIESPEWAVCSASHELFFRRRGRRLTSRPMKGTAPRGTTPSGDAEQARWLCRSLKNRAENVMITDMVRNDLGRLADTGSVQTSGLLRLEAYPTVWQLTSTVEGETGADLAEIMRALFPAASITGAPKRRTMEIIRTLETEPREIYTGTIGLVEPGGDAQFNVAIRTALILGQSGRAEYGVGGGILWDSEPAEEYRETRTKAALLERSPASVAPDFQLLETLRWEPGRGFVRLRAHLRRLARSADHFRRPCNLTAIRSKLRALSRTLPPRPHRVRLLLSADGTAEVEAAPLDPQSRPRRVVLASSPSPVLDNPFVVHKSTARSLYEQARQQARVRVPEADDVLLTNERGEVTEATIANLVLDLNGQRVTPPLASGLLPGVYRQWLLDTGKVAEQVVRPADVRAARTVYLVNSLRGMWPVTVLADDD